jgi:chaperonin GroES
MEEEFMKLKPMADNVLLKQFEAPETTVSGIILATATKEKPAIYEVVSAGPGTKEVAMTVAAGDRVVVAKNVGFDVTIDKVDYKFVKLEEILATVTD